MNNTMHCVHPDWLIAQKVAYAPAELVCSDMIQEPESQEYAAGECTIMNRRVKFRVAKITPTKVGQFVTLWKRIGKGPIMPFELSDPIDLFIISVRCDDKLGQFVFPKKLLHEKRFISGNGIEGKRAMRVYPPWDIPDSAQAKKTQDWQSKYFVWLQPVPDIVQLRSLILNGI